jgi:hypothetical protein
MAKSQELLLGQELMAKSQGLLLGQWLSANVSEVFAFGFVWLRAANSQEPLSG